MRSYNLKSGSDLHTVAYITHIEKLITDEIINSLHSNKLSP